MKRLFLAPALGALALATATPAFAQYGRPDPRRPSYGSSRYSEVGRIAYDNGFREGIEEGEKDIRARDRFYYEDEGDFKNGDKGYSRSYGDKNIYRQTFRDGFADGYSEGYRRASRGYDNGRYGGYGSGGGYGQGGGYGNIPRDNRYGYAAAFEIGQQDGYEKGREDARGRNGFDPRRHKWYREGDREYNSRYGSREQYKDEYRRGFTAGYEQGYRGR
ncbi:MAG: hypothetical protein ABIS06_18160 [Vicinamibacterales bacterium]